MTTEDIGFEGESIRLTSFDVPMLHKDWHTAESLGLVYAFYNHVGPDYWDDEMVFCAPEHKDAVKKWDRLHRW
jgi:hypothetical protein